MRRPSRILDADGRPVMVEDQPVRWLHGSYDVYEKRGESDNWRFALPNAANALDTPERRQWLRDASRLEFRNNPHMRGVVNKISHEVVGTGPRMEIEPEATGKAAEQAAKRLEDLTNEHLEQIGTVGKLTLGNTERILGGEAFNVFHRNPRNEIPIDFTVYEGDQFATPFWQFSQFGLGETDSGPVDGIEFDRWGNPTTYHRLRQHPHGTSTMGMIGQDIDYLDASIVSHLFRKDRPTQYRGVAETAAMLALYNQLRRFVESKVGQEELRAKIQGAIVTGFSPDVCTPGNTDPIDMYVSGGHFMNLPAGWEPKMFEHAVTGMGVAEFMRAMLAWATNALMLPWNISAGDSSDYNFASGRLDYIIFYRVIDVIRQHIEHKLLNPYFRLFISIAEQTSRFPSRLGRFKATWYWPPRQPIDQAKQANADKILKESGLLDEAEYWQRTSAKSWKEAELQKIKIEKFVIEKRAEHGLAPLVNEATEPTGNPNEETATE